MGITQITENLGGTKGQREGVTVSFVNLTQSRIDPLGGQSLGEIPYEL